MKGKVKYYFKKPRGAIAKDILWWLATAGAIWVAASSPYFIRGLLRAWKKGRKYQLRSKEATFYRMRKQGLIIIERKGHRYNVRLTEKGRQCAGWLQLDALQVKKSKKWKKLWYFLMFDIIQVKRWKRDILRSFLERMGFVFFQKSVWVHAYDCRPEIEVLKEFLGLTLREIKLIVVLDKGLSPEDSARLRKIFKV